MAEKWKPFLAALGITAALAALVPNGTVMAEQIQTVCLMGVEYPADSTELTLSGLTAEEVESLLPQFPKLQKVILTDTASDDETLDQLNRAYPDIQIVWTVQVGKIPVRTDETWFYTAGKGYLPNNEDLKKLRYCTQMIAVDVGHLQVTDCSWLESMPHLKYLILAWSGVQDISPLANCKELVYLELDHCVVRDYTPLQGCTALEDLNINDHDWPASIEPLLSMTWLKTLWVPTRSYEEKEALVAALPDTRVVTVNYGTTFTSEYERCPDGQGWRNLKNYYDMRDLLGMYYMK